LTDSDIKQLKGKNLIEGRKPNFYISSTVAKATGEKASYIKQRGIDDEYCQKILLDYLKKFGEGKRVDFEKILLDKLPDILDIEQKKNKIKNNLQALRKQGLIEPKGKLWIMSKTD
jgi:ATP-dependent DNA helicase RecG